MFINLFNAYTPTSYLLNLVSLIKSTSFITEIKSHIGFSNSSQIESAETHNTIKQKEGVEMRSSADGGAYINFPLPNPNDEWAFELEFNNPNLHYPEFAGLYLWYTDGPPEKGTFKGVDGKFVGMVAGLELLGKYVELTLGTNDGELDAAEYEEILLMKDSVDPRRFHNVTSFTMKIISTSKNFKMEIYDQNKNLIYDNLRYLKTSILGDLKKGKHFTITTSYEKVPTYKVFTLKRAELFSRQEKDGYDPLIIRSVRPSTEPRYYDSVDHSNRNVQHLISNLEHFVAYMKAVIGDPIGMSLLKGMSNYSQSIKAYNDSLEDLVARLEEDIDPPAVINDIQAKIEVAEGDLASLEHMVSSLSAIIQKIEKRTQNTIINIFVLMGLGFCVLVILRITKNIFIRLFFKKKK